MQFVGTLVQKISEKSGVSAHGPWKSAEYLLATVENEPKKMVVKVMNGGLERIATWDRFIGKNVVIEFEIEAKEYNGKYFNNINAWKISGTDPEPPKDEAPSFGLSGGRS